MDYLPGEAWEVRLAAAGQNPTADLDEVWTAVTELVAASPGFAALVLSIRLDGIREPIEVTGFPVWRIVEGTRRLIAATRAGCGERIPVVVLPDV